MERYKQVCKQINEQINPSEEFIQDLKSNLNKKVAEEKMKRKYYLSKVAMIFCTLTLVSSGVFAKDIGNWLSQIFSNTDEAMMVAVENGYVQNVEMDYIEHEDIGIKVNSLIIDDNKMNIVFDVKGEIDGELAVKEMYLTTEENEYVTENSNLLSTSYTREYKRISNNAYILIIKFSNLDQDLKCGENLNITIKGLCIMNKENGVMNIDKDWNCNVLLEEEHFKNIVTMATNYVIQENEYIEDYEINVNNTGMNIKIYLKKDLDKYTLINKENIYAITEDGKKYVCRDWSGIKSNMIQMNIPITTYDNIDEFDLILKLEKEEIKFNIKKENS